MRASRAAAWVLCAAAWNLAGQDLKPKTTISGSLQTGLAETFQLTLGGMFGDGPAFQNRGTVSFNHVFRKNDSVSAFGWMTFDGPSRHVDSQTGAAYKYRIIDRKSNLLTGTAGYQRWDFPSVASGTHDNLIAGNLTWQTRVKVPVTVSADSWRLLTSNLPIGSLLYTQAWTTHQLWSNDHGRLMLRPTVASTYSWNFYAKQGYRVFRYGALAAWEARNYTIEGGVRRQVALQPGIPENSFWSVSVARLF